MTTLTKNELWLPGKPIRRVIPGTPPSPAYCLTTTRMVQGYRTVYMRDDDGTIVGVFEVSTGVHPYTTTVCYEATLGTPSTIEVRPSTVMSRNIGWNASAVSLGSIGADGMYQFTVPDSVVGVITGFNDGDIGSGYIEIDYGIFFESGRYHVLENGVPKTAPEAYVSADIFTIRRLGSEVAYFQGSTKIYTSLTPSAGVLIADASLYFAGDSIVDPYLDSTVDSTFAASSGGADGELGGLQGYAANFDYVAALGELTPLTGTAGAYAYGWSAGTLGGLAGYAANYIYADASSTLGGIDGYSESGMLAPQHAGADAILGAITGLSTGYVGNSGGADGNLTALTGFAANFAYAEVRGVLPPLVGEVYSGLSSASVRVVHGGSYDVLGYAHQEQEPWGFAATYAGAYALAANGGAVGAGDLSTATLSATATARTLGRLAVDLPAGTLSATGTAQIMGRFARTYRGAYGVAAYTGAAGAGDLSIGTLAATGTADYLASADLTGPVATLSAAGTVSILASASLTGPALRAAASGVLVATLPMGTLAATGHTVIAVEYEAYSVTLIPLENGQLGTATTHYTNFPFDRIVRFKDTYYGVAADGLYALGGDDFDGTPIVAVAQTMPTDFGRRELKRFPWLYLSGRVGADFNVSIVTDEDDTSTYQYRPVDKAGSGTKRVVFGRGIKAHHAAFKFTNVAGEDFTLNDVTPEVDTMRRTV